MFKSMTNDWEYMYRKQLAHSVDKSLYITPTVFYVYLVKYSITPSVDAFIVGLSFFQFAGHT